MVLKQVEIPDELIEKINAFTKEHNLKNTREAVIIIIESYFKNYYSKKEETVNHG